MFTNRWTNKQIVVYPYSGMLLSNKEMNYGHNNINESQNNYAERWQIKTHIYIFYKIYINLYKILDILDMQINPQQQNVVKWLLGDQAQEKARGRDYNRHKDPFGNHHYVYYFDYGDSFTHTYVTT